ncbi:uncharacterized protein SAPINGB_P006436 [Magnusiomyces paraingens]|uniref:RING-type domain-containing protein n=1 Tax=Magnusiomyces paraingens TaxID=2606893 RepID=A0A5E8C9Y9_9ASCO|nr:uncharacterized protein SAPINGB_P006436 [Saprochaete ingens]VVT58891.1 unnamed protein product [Saprochaete ingens]
MVTTSGVVLAYVVPIVVVVLAVLYIVYYIRKHKKRLTSSSSDSSYRSDSRIPGSGSATTAGSSGTQPTPASDQQSTSIGSNGRPRRQRYRRRRRLRNFLTGQSNNPDDPEERRSLFGHHGDSSSTTTTTTTRTTTRSTTNSRQRQQQQQARRNRNRAPRPPNVPPPTRGKEDEEWADAYNHVLRDNPYALTLYELDAMFPAQQFKREKHDLYRLARKTSMKARDLQRRSLQRASTALRNSTVSAAMASAPSSRPTSVIGNNAIDTSIPPVPPIDSVLSSQTSLVNTGGQQVGAIPATGSRPQTPVSQTLTSPRAPPFNNNLANFSDVSLSSSLHESIASPLAQPLPKGPMAYGSSIVRPASVATVGAVSSASINPRNSNIRRNISLPIHRSAPTTPATTSRFGPHRAHTLNDDEDSNLLHHLDGGSSTAYDSYAHGDLERGPDPVLSRNPIIDQDDSDYEWVYEEYTDDDDEDDNERRRRRDDLARNDSDNESNSTNENWLQTVASMFSPLGPAAQNIEYNDLHDLNPPQISDDEAGLDRRHSSGARRLQPLRSASADGHLRGRHSDEDFDADNDSDEDLVLQAAAVSRGASLKRMSAAAGLTHHYSLPAAPRVNRHTSTMSASGMAIRNAIHTIPESSEGWATNGGAAIAGSSAQTTPGPSADTPLISTATSPSAGQPDLSVVHEDAEPTHSEEEEEKPVSHVQIVGEDNDFVFCPICQGTIREKEEDDVKPERISEEPEEGTESDEATRVEEEEEEEKEDKEEENDGDKDGKKAASKKDAAATTSTTDGLEDNDHIVRLLSCNHVFHDECITPWLTTSKALCPLCKRDFRNEIPVEVLRAESV